MNVLMLIAQVAQSSSDRWADLLFGLDQNQRFVILLVAIGCTAGVICTLVGCVSSAASTMHRHRLEAEMKRDMLDRGMNAEEIARVVESSQPKDFLERWAAACNKKKVG